MARVRLGVVVVANRGGTAEPGRHLQGRDNERFVIKD